MAEFSLNQTYHGFTLEKIEEISDVHSTAYLFLHERSGARLFYLKNTDNNKVFNVAFKTPPADDCGTPHILEHSVLCGSRKYEAKDPFNELAKGSLNTFLNAMTYADKTMYPIASCNEKDFHNLMDVYMDAVFFPKIYEKKEIFQQEGWRYLLKDADAPLEVTGVVYNEMKGALSDPESLLSGVISRSIFGKTTYGFESGGDPAAIPDLTYENFLDFHRKYYHPSNAYFFLYGNMEPLACLRHIDDGFLKEFTRSAVLPVIRETECVKRGEIVHETYPAAEEGEEGGTFLTYNLKVGKCTDPERIMALQILSYILLETNASPLKTALIEGQICQETEGWFDSSTYEMVFSIVAKNADAEKANEFIRIIEEEWKRQIAEGLPKDLLKGALRKYDFLLREEDYGSTPKGLIYCSRLMKRWLHGEDPCDSLRLLEIIETLKKGSGENYFEKLMEDVFLNNIDKTYVVFTPEKGKAQKEAEAFAAKMAKRKEAMTHADFEELKVDVEKLSAFQKQEDSPEILEQIPLLEISEIDEKPQLTGYQKETLGFGNSLLHVPLESNGILYLKLMFDTSAVPQELLPYTGLLTDLLGKLDTESYSYQELSTVKNQVFGGFSLHNNIYNIDESAYRSFVTVKEKLLKEDLDAAISMTEEILFRTKFDSVESMKKIVKSAKIKGENELLNNSHYFAIFYSGSNLFPGQRVEDITSGIRYYRFLCETDTQLERDPAPVIEKLKETASILITRQNINVALGSERADKAEVQEKLAAFQAKLPSREQENAMYHFDIQPEKSAFTSSGGVLYNITSFDYKKYGIDFHGKYQVLKTIINLEYLWNQIRVQGGAYGCGCKFMRSGFSYFYSYRDPNLTETYHIYQKLYKEIQNFKADTREMTKFILGTINGLDQPKTNMDLLNEAISKFYKNIIEEDLIQERLEILHTTAEDIRSCKNLLECIDCANICSIGNEQKIKTNADTFTKIEPLV
ncbi:MAG: insulinase family protein [Bacteroidales bacterium]|nr:insulinase family protein [Anaerotignum sp.]MCI5679531.1 insulinase family protein [Bacteroidales bacterium]MDY3927010.1 insulinase family protein [Anaerotignum sp.]